MAECKDGIPSVDRRAWGYSQPLKCNGRIGNEGCIRLDCSMVFDSEGECLFDIQDLSGALGPGLKVNNVKEVTL